MVGRNTAVSGIYRLKEMAERALDTLIAGAIPCSSISVVLLDCADPRIAGAGKDGAIGGTIGILAGAGALAVPGLGRIIGAGPVMAGFPAPNRAGPQPGAPDGGGLVRALIGIGIPEREAQRCEADIRKGDTLLSVSCGSAEQVSRARNLLAGTGAIATKADSGDTRVA
jgi:hypothetical protein